MSSNKVYDIAYIGIGLSTITHYIKNKNLFKNKNICFIEKFPSINNCKTIAGFAKEISIPYIKRYTEFECRFGHEKKIYNSHTPYYLVDLKKTLEIFFDETINCDFFYNFNVKKIHERGLYKIIGQGEDILAIEIFDSRPPYLPKKGIIKQHFLGWYIYFEDKHNLKNPILMDIDPEQKDLCFTYVLPIDPQTLLTEVTFYSENILSTEQYEFLLKSYLQKNFSNNPYKIMKKEKGAIPLVNIRPEIKASNYHCLGIRGGYLRASTGYSVISFLNQSRPTRFLQYLDSFLLKVLWRSPEKGHLIFTHFLKKINGETLANFMSDKPSLINIFRSAFSMPLSIFAFHLFKQKKGLQTFTTLKDKND